MIIRDGAADPYVVSFVEEFSNQNNLLRHHQLLLKQIQPDGPP